MDIISKKNWYFGLSLLVIVPGIISLLLWGLRLSIDFTGGSRLTFINAKNSSINVNDAKHIKNVFVMDKIAVNSIQTSEKTIILRTKPLDQKKNQLIVSEVAKISSNSLI